MAYDYGCALAAKRKDSAGGSGLHLSCVRHIHNNGRSLDSLPLRLFVRQTQNLNPPQL